MNEFVNLPKKELLRHTGLISQVAGITRFTVADGNGRGIPAVHVKNGSGLEYTVFEGRNMDMYDLEYKGVNLAFFYKNGLTAPERVSHTPGEFLGQSSGGMLYTSGLQNSGPENEAEGLFQPLHGRMHAMGAEDVCTKACFDEKDRFILEISGKTRESRLFRHNLTMTRTIRTELNSNSFRLTDVIENETCRDTMYSLMYHINFGYPFLDEGTEIVVSDKTVSAARTEMSKKYFEERFKMTAPIDNFEEHLYFHDVPADADGLCHAMIINHKMNLAVELAYTKAQMKYLVEWKSMGAGDYALGVMPSTSLLRGRHDELEADGLTRVEAFSKAFAGVTYTVIEGAEAIAARAADICSI